MWNLSLDVSEGKCPKCQRPTYHLLKNALTESGDAREWAIVARGIVVDDGAEFERQGFHVLFPQPPMRYNYGLPTITGELTNEDGSLR